MNFILLLLIESQHINFHLIEQINFINLFDKPNVEVGLHVLQMNKDLHF
jgi:hypothetical protein